MPVDDPRRAPRTGGSLPWVIGGSALGALLLGTALWLAASGGDRRQDPRGHTPGPTPAKQPQYFLLVDLRRVDAIPVDGGAPPRVIRPVAEAVRETLTGVYSSGFVDPAGWQGGRFPALFDHFAGDAREQARRDLNDLTLGSSAGRFETVRPERARMSVRVLVGSEGRPISAIASMEFRATGLGAGVGDTPILHRGRYVLRPVGGRWLIVAYDVRGRLGPGGPA